MTIRLTPRHGLLRRDRDSHRLARIAGEAGEHGFDQVRHQVVEAIGSRDRFRLAFEQPLAVDAAVDLDLYAAGEDGVALDTRIEPGVWPAEAPRPAASPITEAAGAVPEPPEGIKSNLR